MTDNQAYVRLAVLIIGVLCVLMVVSSLMTPVRALPPRPTPSPTPLSSPESQRHSSAGGYIELHAQFPKTGLTYPWQDLWTVVQWQGEQGYWYNVEGWQGTLDEVTSIAGTKLWWVSKFDLGKGPFRWRVYRWKGGWLLAESEPFYLPSSINAKLIVDVELVQ
jgi:hypothetical protein